MMSSKRPEAHVMVQRRDMRVAPGSHMPCHAPAHALQPRHARYARICCVARAAPSK